MSDGIDDLLAATAQKCRLKLEEQPFRQILDAIGAYREPHNAFRLLSEVAFCPGLSEPVEQLRASVGNGRGDLLEQVLLILASLHAVKQVPDLAVAGSVKRLLAAEFEFFADPPAMWIPHFRLEDLRYREMARIATFRRFPAGQLEWQLSEFRWSWVFQSRLPLRVLSYVTRRMGGFAPLFELHVNPRRRKRLVLLEKETNISYHRVGRSLEKQPDVRGVMLRSWLFCESTAEVTPRLAWLRRTPLAAGALIVDLREAQPESGYLTGSAERRQLYIQGVYLPATACVLWPRQSLIDWANRHPEFDG